VETVGVHDDVGGHPGGGNRARLSGIGVMLAEYSVKITQTEGGDTTEYNMKDPPPVEMRRTTAQHQGRKRSDDRARVVRINARGDRSSAKEAMSHSCTASLRVRDGLLFEFPRQGPSRHYVRRGAPLVDTGA
jgi:hypothetical protein